jgi:hypothetical protein
MQTVRDYIKESIKHTLRCRGESVLLEEKIYKKFISENKVTQKQLRRQVNPIMFERNTYVDNKKVLRTVPIPTERELKILIHIENVTNIPIADILGRSRKREKVDARRMFMVILNVYLNVDLMETGRKVGRDHSTVIHAVNTHDSYMESEPTYRRMFGRVIDLLRQEFPLDFEEREAPDFKNFNKQLNREKWDKLVKFQEEQRAQYAKVN